MKENVCSKAAPDLIFGLSLSNRAPMAMVALAEANEQTVKLVGGHDDGEKKDGNLTSLPIPAWTKYEVSSSHDHLSLILTSGHNHLLVNRKLWVRERQNVRAT